MSSSSNNGSTPPRGGRARLSRRISLLLGAGAAIVIAAVLVAPVVIGGGSTGGSCAQALTYLGGTYVAREVSPARIVEVTAIGVGVARGCGAPPSNVDVRSLAGISPALALGVTADQSSIYVRRGVCPRATPRRLLACLRRA